MLLPGNWRGSTLAAWPDPHLKLGIVLSLPQKKVGGKGSGEEDF